MPVEIKIRLEEDLIRAIDFQRIHAMPKEDDVSIVGIPSRNEMIRRLIGIGLAANLKKSATNA